MTSNFVILALIIGTAILSALSFIRKVGREFDRFAAKTNVKPHRLLGAIDWWLKFRAARRSDLPFAKGAAYDKEAALFSAAGLGTPEEREKFYLIRDILVASGPIIGIHVAIIANWAAATFVGSVIVLIGYFGPRFWVREFANGRRREVIHEMPFIKEIVSALAENGVPFEDAVCKIANAHGRKVSRHMLVNSVRRLRWQVASGAELPKDDGIFSIEKVLAPYELNDGELSDIKRPYERYMAFLPLWGFVLRFTFFVGLALALGLQGSI